ncbi:competence protein ComK [Staphylococcus massiliensis]|uniref:Competence protein ComK n=1 Tax=Staphylococcus massiliensis S46 TaxID=1229783 RepID=K9ASJ1_9STAP|nr:competence protein ComK [Staphylococcus massiliensis]EKU50289.1 hypothetical protein C273_01565 [Staphylococcus massiliensis S46]MCG3399685.1 competence protein ComK [Staphylococcus massiliensis]MCG3412046.1 competence protein ComK [Staphylococcus massiliensis]PNZ98647.1 hypothetical protein CD133_08240 [Staphylococcus massiliensis CCUG 55927]
MHVPTHSLLYFTTSYSQDFQFDLYYMQQPQPVQVDMTHVNLLNMLLHKHQKSLKTQKAIAKQILNINKLLPIFVHNDLLLLPLFAKRSPINTYINLCNVVGLSQQSTNETTIHFKGNVQLSVNLPYQLLSKKWKEGLMLYFLSYAID